MPAVTRSTCYGRAIRTAFLRSMIMQFRVHGFLIGSDEVCPSGWGQLGWHSSRGSRIWWRADRRRIGGAMAKIDGVVATGGRGYTRGTTGTVGTMKVAPLNVGWVDGVDSHSGASRRSDASHSSMP